MFSRRAALQGSLLVGFAGALPIARSWAQTPAALNPQLDGDISPVHDPSIIREGDTYYVFSTNLGGGAGAQIPWRFSKNLRHWEKGGYVFPDLPAWAVEAVELTEAIWAPDISYANGQYLLYYACSTFGKNRSVIGLATNTTLNPASPNFKWVDRGLVLQSKSSDDFNAIDPSHIVDRAGNHWLAFGSFWGGIKMVKLDPQTLKPPPGPLQLSSLARRPVNGDTPDAIEGAVAIEREGYYYLFVSFDFCCRGADSNYWTVVGRSRNVSGPYGDNNRYDMIDGNGLTVLKAEKGARWRGPGGCSILRDPGQDYIVYHAYDARRDGTPTLRIAPLIWSADGWPTAIV
ncbi:MAG: arabinan endo-1,5-alpha-L-arabinosidase [Rhizomicrobium sp.]